MSDKRFVDTNILVYAHDRSAGNKHIRAQKLIEELWQCGFGALSTQVLQEFCAAIQRKPAQSLGTDELRELIQDYSKWEIVVNTPESVVRALELQSRYQLSFWDALILQAADECGAAVIYSEDFSHGRIYGSVRAANPFDAPE